MDFYSASSLKQQSAGRYVAPLEHIILTESTRLCFWSLLLSTLWTNIKYQFYSLWPDQGADPRSSALEVYTLVITQLRYSALEVYTLVITQLRYSALEVYTLVITQLRYSHNSRQGHKEEFSKSINFCQFFPIHYSSTYLF